MGGETSACELKPGPRIARANAKEVTATTSLFGDNTDAKVRIEAAPKSSAKLVILLKRSKNWWRGLLGVEVGVSDGIA